MFVRKLIWDLRKSTYRISNVVIQEIDSNDDIAERDVEKLIINIVKEKEN